MTGLSPTIIVAGLSLFDGVTILVKRASDVTLPSYTVLTFSETLSPVPTSTYWCSGNKVEPANCGRYRREEGLRKA